MPTEDLPIINSAIRSLGKRCRWQRQLSTTPLRAWPTRLWLLFCFWVCSRYADFQSHLCFRNGRPTMRDSSAAQDVPYASLKGVVYRENYGVSKIERLSYENITVNEDALYLIFQQYWQRSQRITQTAESSKRTCLHNNGAFALVKHRKDRNGRSEFSRSLLLTVHGRLVSPANATYCITLSLSWDQNRLMASFKGPGLTDRRLLNGPSFPHTCRKTPQADSVQCQLGSQIFRL